MNIFISWSGAKSRLAAEALRDWLPSMIQATKPWVSSEDIAKGARWSSDLTKQLETSKVGIICLTIDNMQSPWLLFEAGALAKTLGQSYVCPWLLDFTENALKGPLVQFQATRADKEDTRKLVHTINSALEDNAIDNERLDKLYDALFPQLEEKLNSLTIITTERPVEEERESEMLAELLELVRDLKRGMAIRDSSIDGDALLKERAAKFDVEEQMSILELEHRQRVNELKLKELKAEKESQMARMEMVAKFMQLEEKFVMERKADKMEMEAKLRQLNEKFNGEGNQDGDDLITYQL